MITIIKFLAIFFVTAIVVALIKGDPNEKTLNKVIKSKEFQDKLNDQFK